MYKKVSLFLIAAFSFAVLGGCASLTGLMGSGGGSANSEEFEADQALIVAAFQASIVDVLNGQALLMDGLDLKEDAAELRAVAKAASQGNSSKADMDTRKKVSGKANENANQKMKDADGLTNEQKQSIKDGMRMFIQGNSKAVTVLALATAFGSAVAEAIAADPMNAVTLQNDLAVGIYLASELPDYVSTNGQFIATGLEFLKSNGTDTSDIETQGDADKNAGAE